MIVTRFGSLLQMYVLDDRQYRSPQACPRPGMGGGTVVQPARCPDLRDSGAHAPACGNRKRGSWKHLAPHPARWNVLAQQTLMAQHDWQPGPDQPSGLMLGWLSHGAVSFA